VQLPPASIAASIPPPRGHKKYIYDASHISRSGGSGTDVEGETLYWEKHGLELETYDDIVGRLEELETSHKDQMNVYTFGTSSGGKDLYGVDIYAGTGTPKETVFITAGHHGTEGGGVEAAMEFIENYLESDTPFAQQLKERVRFTIVPCVNVDQYALAPAQRAYNNLNDRDLNSQYNRRRGIEPESKAVKELYLSIEEPINLAFDLHETEGEWVKGFSIFENKPYRRRILNHAAHAAGKVSKQYPLHSNGVIHDINPSCFDGFACGEGAYSYTFEAPLSKKFAIEDRVEMQLIALDDIITLYYKDRV
jgi:hypothetical protein